GGVIKMLLLGIELGYITEILTIPRYFNAIQNTMNNYVDIQLPDGNMPTATSGTCSQYYGNDPDARVQWCHGAPGFIDVFLSASYIWQKFNINSTLSQIYLNS